MRLWVPLASLALLSCGDPTLEVSLLVPGDYQEDVVSASLAIVVPPQGAPFNCDDIAFGRADDGQVRANTVEEVALRDGKRVELGGIPREADKLLLARGFDSTGEELVAGCTPFGLVDDSALVQITGEIVTLASIPDFDPLQVVGRSSEVRITDVRGRLAPDIEVQWTTTAPGAPAASDTARSDAEGVVLVQVGQIPLPGPVAVDVRARWARSEPLVVSGFRNPSVLFADTLPNADNSSVRNPDEIYQVGRVGPGGEMGLVAMGSPEVGLERRAYVAYYDPAAASFKTQESELLPASAASLALLTIDGRDHVFTTTTTAVIEILSDGSLAATPLGSTLPLIRRFFTLGNCSDPETIDELLTLSLDGSTRAIRDGILVESIFAGDSAPGVPIASGCLTSGDGLHRGVVYLAGDEVILLVDIDGPRQTSLGIVPAGIAYSASTSEEDALLLATTLGIEGTDIVRFHIVPVDADKLDVQLVASDATPTFAQSTASGDFDGDGLTDIVAVLVFGDTGEATDYRIYMAMGLQNAIGRVIGVSGPKAGQRPRIFVRDFDGDGHDDVLVGSNGSYEIFSMGPPP